MCRGGLCLSTGGKLHQRCASGSGASNGRGDWSPATLDGSLSVR